MQRQATHLWLTGEALRPTRVPNLLAAVALAPLAVRQYRWTMLTRYGLCSAGGMALVVLDVRCGCVLCPVSCVACNGAGLGAGRLAVTPAPGVSTRPQPALLPHLHGPHRACGASDYRETCGVRGVRGALQPRRRVGSVGAASDVGAGTAVLPDGTSLRRVGSEASHATCPAAPPHI